MLNKNVCPNCGQLYDTNLSKCPLCGTAPQVVDTADPVQRKRITETERKQRRAERKEAEQEAKRRRKDALFIQDADEERLIEEEEARRKEEKRRLKEEKKAARRGAQEQAEEAEGNETVFTPVPARDGRGPMAVEVREKDPRRIPRIFLALSAIVLGAALLVGGAYLLWKTETLELPIFDELAAKKEAQAAETQADGSTEPAETEAPARPRNGDPVPCTGISLDQTEITFNTRGQQTQLKLSLTPSDTTDERSFLSSDESVVKVSSVGIVTAVGSGSATLTVSCGSQKAECTVICSLSEDTTAATEVSVDALTLNKNDITFFASGENYVLSVTNIPIGTPVRWESLDESICTVDAGGHVVAVGEGTTRVFAYVGDLETFCWVRCRFE